MNARILIPTLALALVAGLGCENKQDESVEVPIPTEPTAAEEAPAEAPPAEAAATNGAAAADPATAEIDLDAIDPAKATLTAPDKFQAKFETTAGDFTIDVTRDWAPHGADRFYNLVKMGFFNDVAIFRVIDGFMAQFGIHGMPEASKKWIDAKIPDDPAKEGVSNKPGYVTFATGGPNTRTTQLFINYGDNARLDAQGFTPFGVVSGEGMEVVNKFYKGYGEGAPMGRGPAQGRVQAEGNKYLRAEFPELTYIKSVTIVGEEPLQAVATPQVGDKPAAAAKKGYEAGAYADKAIAGGGFDAAEIRINLTDDGKVQGSFKGRREGKGFMIPLSGDIAQDGTFTAVGEKGQNKATASGRFTNGELHGKIDGSVNQNGMKVTFNAKK